MLHNPRISLGLHSARSILKRPSLNVRDHFEVPFYLLQGTTFFCFLFPWHFDVSIYRLRGSAHGRTNISGQLLVLDHDAHDCDLLTVLPTPRGSSRRWPWPQMWFPTNEWAFVGAAIVPIWSLYVDGLFNDAHWHTFIRNFDLSSGLERKVIVHVLLGKLLHQLHSTVVYVIGLLASLCFVFSQGAANSRPLYEFDSSIYSSGELDWHVAHTHLCLVSISQR